MLRKILLAIVLIFLITGMGFAFQNEPDGFRGLKWGDAPTEDMEFSYQVISKYDIYKGNYYYKKSDKLKIGSAKLDSIRYLFNLYSNQFYKVQAIFTGETNYNILEIILEGRYGKPTSIRERKDGYFLWWTGDKVEISLFFYSKEKKGLFIIRSKKIRSENPEDNKQKEVEKAEEDF